jgi:5-methylcytosine-specific restriction endonuclease McrA
MSAMGLFYDNDAALDAAERSRASQIAREERKNRRKRKVKAVTNDPPRYKPLPVKKVAPIDLPKRERPAKWLKYKKGMGLEFYDSDKWREIRAHVLKAGKGVCCKCGGTKVSTGLPMHVDHAYPRYHYPSLELDPKNLQVMCQPCNMLKKSNIWVSPWLIERRKQLENGMLPSNRCQNPPP